MYNEKLIGLAEETSIKHYGHKIYRINNIYFYIMDYKNEEWISYIKDYDIFWQIEESEKFYNKMTKSVKIEKLTEK